MLVAVIFNVSVSQLKITTEFMAEKVKLELSQKKTLGLFSSFLLLPNLGFTISRSSLGLLLVSKSSSYSFSTFLG